MKCAKHPSDYHFSCSLVQFNIFVVSIIKDLAIIGAVFFLSMIYDRVGGITNHQVPNL